MAKETKRQGRYQHNCAGNVGSAVGVSSSMLNERYQHGKESGGQQHAGAVNTDAANPFFKVMAMGPENKPLISQKRERDGEQIRDEARQNISIGDERV